MKTFKCSKTGTISRYLSTEQQFLIYFISLILIGSIIHIVRNFQTLLLIDSNIVANLYRNYSLIDSIVILIVSYVISLVIVSPP